MKSKGQIEAEISDAITRFEKGYMGRGPTETQTYLVDDMVIVRLRGVLTPAEQQLAKADDPSRGRRLIKEVRGELLESARMLLANVVQDITKRAVVSLHTDISVTVGERVIIFTLDGQPAYGEQQAE
jgi:uncharacterized protein YbcI